MLGGRIKLWKHHAQRIGHFSMELELYLCRREKEEFKGSYDLIILPKEKIISNHQLSRMWIRYFKTHRTRSCLLRSAVSVYLGESMYFGPWLGRYENEFLLPGNRKVHVDKPKHSDPDNYLAGGGAHLSFNDVELEKGRGILKEMGVSTDQPFVLVHARDSAYLKQKYPHQDFSHHDYRDADIDNYIPAMELLASRGFSVIRMGAIVEKPLNLDNPCIIDYAESPWQSEFMDVFLSAHCHFFLCSNAGIHGLPRIFRRPVFFVNIMEIHGQWGEINFFIPKKYNIKKTGQLMTFRDILEKKAGLPTQEFLQATGVELLENSPEEIVQAALEMSQRIDGSWECTHEDERDQEAFQTLLKSYAPGVKGFARIGTHFLRTHRALLN